MFNFQDTKTLTQSENRESDFQEKGKTDHLFHTGSRRVQFQDTNLLN